MMNVEMLAADPCAFRRRLWLRRDRSKLPSRNELGENRLCFADILQLQELCGTCELRVRDRQTNIAAFAQH